MVRYWTMRYEAKHNFLKKLAQNLGNFINITWTLASRHQQWHCYQWLNTSTIGQDEPEIGPGNYRCVLYSEMTVCMCIAGDSVAQHDRPRDLESCDDCFR